jgi:anaerobic C4-dicarboxylate transporter
MGFWLQLAILLAAIVLGARRGGMALVPMGGIGLVIFVFLFGLPPGSPPGTVLGMILAVITALSLLEAAGGLELVVRFAERVLRRHPRRVTFLAPLVTYALVLASGTQHVIYALLPVIAEVARKAGIRPERPLDSVIAARQGLIASPVSAVAAAGRHWQARRAAESSWVIPASLIGLAAGDAAGVPGKDWPTIPSTRSALPGAS